VGAGHRGVRWGAWGLYCAVVARVGARGAAAARASSARRSRTSCPASTCRTRRWTRRTSTCWASSASARRASSADQTSDCRIGLVCASGTCRAVGTSGINIPCILSDECGDGLYCGLTGTCQPVGVGAAGAPCASSGECATGQYCQVLGFTGVCAPTGSGDLGQACGSQGDCLGGLLCGAEGTCEVGGIAFGFRPWARGVLRRRGRRARAGPLRGPRRRSRGRLLPPALPERHPDGRGPPVSGFPDARAGLGGLRPGRAHRRGRRAGAEGLLACSRRLLSLLAAARLRDGGGKPRQRRRQAR
jgi:hypothetical protein